jgi:hypothetical protein
MPVTFSRFFILQIFSRHVHHVGARQPRPHHLPGQRSNRPPQADDHGKS